MINNDLEKAIINISEQVEDRDLVLFLGSGASYVAGNKKPMLWDGFIKFCGNVLKHDVKTGIQPENNKDALQYLDDLLGNDLIKRLKLAKSFKKEYEGWQSTRLHDVLSKFHTSEIWTTNYDNCIERKLNKEGRSFDVICSFQSCSIAMSKKDTLDSVNIYKMHGCCDWFIDNYPFLQNQNKLSPTETLVITDNDYKKLIKNDSLFTPFLHTALFKKTIIFLGFGFKDPNVSKLLNRFKSYGSIGESKHFWINRIENDEIKKEIVNHNQKKELEKIGIEIIDGCVI